MPKPTLMATPHSTALHKFTISARTSGGYWLEKCLHCHQSSAMTWGNPSPEHHGPKRAHGSGRKWEGVFFPFPPPNAAGWWFSFSLPPFPGNVVCASDDIWPLGAAPSVRIGTFGPSSHPYLPLNSSQNSKTPQAWGPPDQMALLKLTPTSPLGSALGQTTCDDSRSMWFNVDQLCPHRERDVGSIFIRIRCASEE